MRSDGTSLDNINKWRSGKGLKAVGLFKLISGCR